MSRRDQEQDRVLAQMQEKDAKQDLKMALDAYCQRGIDNCQDMGIRVNEAWASFSEIMKIKKEKTTEFDLLGALETAIGLVPVVGEMAKSVRDVVATSVKIAGMIGSAVNSTDGAKYDMGTAGNIPQLRAAHRKVSKMQDKYAKLQTAFNVIYPKCSSEELKGFIRGNIKKPVARMVDDDRLVFRYVTEYQLFKAYVSKNVVVGREPTWIDGKGMVERGPWIVRSGLNGAQEHHIYKTFGGGLPGNDPNAGDKLRGKMLWAGLTGDRKLMAETAWKMLTTRVSHVPNANSLRTVWGATWKDRPPTQMEHDMIHGPAVVRVYRGAVKALVRAGTPRGAGVLR